MFGAFVAIVTFPGIILHEWAHKFCCDRCHVPVLKTCYFRLGNPAGYVIHGPVDNFGKAFLIATAPFLINTVAAVAFFSVSVAFLSGLSLYILCWLGISTAMHSFPSSQDADNLWDSSKNAWRRNPLVLFSFPVIGLMKLGGLVNNVWLDLIYAVALFLLVAYLFKGSSLFTAAPLTF